MSSDYIISPCTETRRAEALRVLHAGLPSDQQLALVQSLKSVRDQDDSVFEGLLVASSQNQLLGAAWAQLTAGRTAVTWMPDAKSPTGPALVRALADFLDSRDIVLAQFLASNSETVSPELLHAGDFQQLAKLAYLSIEKSCFSTQKPTGPLTFHPNADSNPQRLGELLLRTYEGSLDCPALNGLRSATDVIQGYREQGNFAPERWFFVQQKEHDVGALLLTAYEDTGNWEIVYMGLLPEARGVGWGREVLEYAMWQAGLGGAERLVLAVDQANLFASAMYEQAGFTVWDQRIVYARLRPTVS